MRCKNLLLPADLGQFTGVHAAHIAHSYNAELNIFFLPFDASVISTHIFDNRAEMRQGFWLLLSIVVSVKVSRMCGITSNEL
jgi:hypothetical protein